MPKPATPKSLAKPIAGYYAALSAYRDKGADHERATSHAFHNLLEAAAKPHRWTLIGDQVQKVRSQTIFPDGTLIDDFNLHRGYWEAKDTGDDLLAEIQKKIKKGYPLTNTIFEDTHRAILYQAGRSRLDIDLTDPASLADLLSAFFSYTEPNIAGFEQAVDEFKERVPDLARALAAKIADAHKTNKKFKDAFAAFFALCQTALNPNISQAAVDEMLIQHLLTARLFRTIFNNPDFTQRNAIAAEVEKVIHALASASFSLADFLQSLDKFYIAIEKAAESLTDFTDKQHFLNTVYERFFQGYCVKTADTHGIVYTPQPIVDFMCASVEHILKEEFDAALGDPGVIVLDPCTGTGNFVVNLLRRAGARGKKPLDRMYREQTFANEIMLMPYYIAALNIEHAYLEETGKYEPFEGLCFVDTLELAEPKHTGLFTEKNAERVTRQKDAPITVVIGNPPYNVGQMIHNEQNTNRPYPAVDQWIRASYAKDSRATSVSKLNDPYVKFFKWATRRLEDRDGIVCFVSNNSFVENFAFDGMRKHLARDFQAIYHLDLEGNVRHNPTLSGTQYNVFGIQVGVGITIAVKHKKPKSRGIRYAVVDKTIRRSEKLASLRQQGSVAGVRWRSIKPDAANTWIKPGHTREFAGFTPIASRGARRSPNGNGNGNDGVIFKDYSLGIATHRDAVLYDSSEKALIPRVKEFIDSYNTEVYRWKQAPKDTDIHSYVSYGKIQWDRDLKNDVKRGRQVTWSPTSIRTSLYRPFSRQHVYFDRVLAAEVYGLPGIFPTESTENVLLGFSGIGHRAPFGSLCAMEIPNLSILSLDGFQWCPFYIYDEDGTNRRENITDWALKRFRERYANKRISKWNIFHYVYALLHHPGYREKFKDNLKRELPRIPFAPDFAPFAKAGEKLARLHLHYDDPKVVKPYPLKEVWSPDKPKSLRVEKMKLSRDKTALIVNDSLTLTSIPPEVFTYRLGNRSALDWIIDQYQVSTDKRSGITSDPNLWGEEHGDEEYIVHLVKQVVTVSLETMKIVASLPAGFAFEPSKRDSDPESEQPRKTETPAPQRPRTRKDKERAPFQLRSEGSPPPRLL